MRRATLLAALLPVVALRSVVACSKTPLDTSSATPDRAQEIASAFCAALKGCCAAAHFTYDDASCEAQLVQQWQSTFDGAKRLNATFDADTFARCKKALADREAECTGDSGAPPGIDAGFVDDIGHACFGIIKGTVAPGAACTDSAECANDSPSHYADCEQDRDPSSPTFTQSYCATGNPHALPGESCAGMHSQSNPTHDYCEPSLGYCTSTTSADGTCVAYAAAGQACGIGAMASQCDQGTFCRASDAGSPTCAPLPGAGERCGQSLVGGRCGTGAYCDTTSDMCAAAKPAFADCLTSVECQSGDCATNVSPDGSVSPGKCAPPSPSFNTFGVSPRTCGFGPNSYGPDDAGIAH
jgi:hypothetical protein